MPRTGMERPTYCDDTSRRPCGCARRQYGDIPSWIRCKVSLQSSLKEDAIDDGKFRCERSQGDEVEVFPSFQKRYHTGRKAPGMVQVGHGGSVDDLSPPRNCNSLPDGNGEHDVCKCVDHSEDHVGCDLVWPCALGSAIA